MTALIIVLIIAFALDGWFFLKRESQYSEPAGSDIDKQYKVYLKWSKMIKDGLDYADANVVCCLDVVKDLCAKYNAPYGKRDLTSSFTEQDLEQQFLVDRADVLKAEKKTFCPGNDHAIIINKLATISKRICNEYDKAVLRYSENDLKRVWKTIYDRETAFEKTLARLTEKHPDMPEEKLQNYAFKRIYGDMVVPEVYANKLNEVMMRNRNIAVIPPYRYYVTLIDRIRGCGAYSLLSSLINFMLDQEVFAQTKKHTMDGNIYYGMKKRIERIEENLKEREVQQTHDKYSK